MTQRTRFSFLALVTVILALSLGTLRARAADPAVTLDSLSKQLADLKTQGDALKTLPAEIKKLQGDVTNLETGLKTQLDTLKPLPASVKKLRRDVAKLQTDLKTQQDTLTNLKQDLAKMMADLDIKVNQRIDNFLIKITQNLASNPAPSATTSTHKCADPSSCSHSCLLQTYLICAPGYGYAWGYWVPLYPASCQVVSTSGCRLGCHIGH